MQQQRIIGRYEGDEKGPLFIAIGGMHGNEPAGVQALEIMFQMLNNEPLVNPDFRFKGCFIGLRGNVQALNKGKRFLQKDLNRQWSLGRVQQIKQTAKEELQAEDLELKELVETIEQEVDRYQPEKFVLLDLHTTTASGGIFCIPTDNPESLRIAVELHAPVIKGMLNGLNSTSLHYFSSENFQPETIAITFEAGQHTDPLSVNRMIAAITNCMRTIGCVRAKDVENRHDRLLQEYSEGLPNVSELLYCHRIQPDDEFRMLPNYHNFQPVQQGEVLAYDRHGPIRAKADGLILMPLYQPQGEDGFFLIRAIESSVFHYS